MGHGTCLLSHVFRPNRGLTLVELVLALSLFSFLMASVGHLVVTSLRVQRTWGQVVVPAQSAERALMRLAHDLQAAQPLFAIPFQVTGGGQGIELARLGTVTDPDGQPVTEWLRVAYRLIPDGEEAALVREEWAWSDDPASREPRRHEALARLLRGRFAVGTLDETDTLGWTSSWDADVPSLPRLVQFEVTLPPAGAEPPLMLQRVIRNPSGQLPESDTP